MRIKGITYDTGFINNGITTKILFDPNIVKREMQIIRNDLHCNAVRITGGDHDRLEIASQLAAASGLQVWYCPFTCDLTKDELLHFLDDAAARAEKLRKRGSEVVFVTGSEISLFTKGFFSGANLAERLSLLKDPMKLREQIPNVQKEMRQFLAEVVAIARKKFHGKITYASIPFEGVDWNLFDFVATDGGYRPAAIASFFVQGIRQLVSQGKPAVITEFGCGTYRGAADLGAQADSNIAWVDGKASHLNGNFIRDEKEQASAIAELYNIFNAQNVEAAFVNTFARYDLPHRENPTEDLDMASGGVVKVYENKFGETYPDMRWEPKLAFKTVSDLYNEKSLTL
jgi:hypothetical protein